MAEVMLTKLMPPEDAPNLLPRERLLKPILGNKRTRIVLITAPAGYGKTVLTLQLSRQINKPLVWFHLDHNDNDPALFLHYLLEGLRNHWPGVGEKVLQLTARGNVIGKQPRFIASLIINDLIRANAEPLLVLDDYHELKEPSVHSLVYELMEHFPIGVFMIINSRTTVPLSLSRLYLAGAARQISTAELCFTREEIAGFLTDRHGPQPKRIVEEIESYTGGWPAALELTGILPPGSRFSKFKQSSGLTCSLYDYLASEVLGKLLPAYQDFLLDSSVFKVLKPERCNLLLERNDSGEMLDCLGEKLLLLTPLAGSDHTYRCHQLFREFLLDRLGDKQVQLQRRAGRLARLHGKPEKAVEHFLYADFDDEALETLEEAGRLSLKQGRWHTLARWLEQLTEAQISSSPWLSYYQAAVEAYRGRLDEAQRWVDLAADLFTAENIRAGLSECLLLQARLMRCRGRYLEAMLFIDQGCAGFTKEDIAQRFDLTLEKGLCLGLSGKMQAADKLLSDALVAARKTGHAPAISHLAETLGHLHYQQGRNAAALRAYNEAIRVSPDHSLPGYYIQDAIPYIYRDWGEVDKAMELARKSVEAKERFQLVETLPSAYTALSYVYFELNDFEKVELYTRKALKLLDEHGGERYFLLLNQALLAWCRYALGHWVEARQLIVETLAAAEEQTDLACGLIQMLTGTVLALMGSIAEAGEILHRAERNLEKMNFKTRFCEVYKALAYIHYASGEIILFQKYARKYLHLGARLNCLGNALLATADLLEPILYFGLEHDIEVLYTQQILVRLGKRSHKTLLELAEHPNPAVRNRVIAPLTEIADDASMQIISRLAKDKSATVQKSAQAYMHSPGGSITNHTEAHAEAKADKAQLDVKTLGLFQLYLDKNELSGWRTRKTREMLALLVHLGKPLHKDGLIEELWPDVELSSGNALFRTNMYYLRRHLDHEGLPDFIHYEHDSYSLKPGSYRIDCLSFEQLVNTGLQEEPLGEIGASLLAKAIRLYRGDYMSDPADYTWAIPRQVRLRHLYLESLLTLSRYYRSRDKNTRAKDYLLKLKEIDPLCEPAHRLLMQVFASLGEHRSMIGEHGSFKQLLREEIGLPPAPETEELYRRLGCYH